MFKNFVRIAICIVSLNACAAEYFVAPDGDDANDGSIGKPFGTVRAAQKSLAPGDIVYFRGGTYAVKESQITQTQGIFARVFVLDKNGTAEKRITYSAYKDEKPVFDLSAVKPPNRITAFFISGSWIHLKGIEVVGVQVTLKEHTQSICIENAGSHNIYEWLSMHDGQAIGIYTIHGGDNLFLNCDAYQNHDFTSEDGKGGNVDGFGCHPSKGSTGNVFRGCRAWFNSDDGFDCINSAESVTFENCWAFCNGYSADFKKLADGNGFKAGGYGATPVERLPRPIPRHVVRFCVAAQNKNSGFYSNHHIGGGDWFNNSAFNNGVNFNFLCRLDDSKTDVPGYGHKTRNNIGLKGKLLANLDAAKCDIANDSFSMDFKVDAKDFQSTDYKELMLPRKSDGNLPEIKFLHPAKGGALIDKSGQGGTRFIGAFTP